MKIALYSLHRLSSAMHSFRIVHRCSCMLVQRARLNIPQSVGSRFSTHTHTQSAPNRDNTVTLENIFSDWNRERVQKSLGSVHPVRTLEMMGMKPGANVKVAAVLVPLCMVSGEPCILLTLRSSSLRKHRGEVSFPGGNQDKTDRDVVHTALRETHEETGLDGADFDVWGHLPPSPSNRRLDIVYPIVARYKPNLDVGTLKLNTDEVEEVFTCRIRDLCDGGSIRVGSTQFRTKPGYTLPVFLSQPHRIWGLSAIILHQVMTWIAPTLYTYKLRHVA